MIEIKDIPDFLGYGADKAGNVYSKKRSNEWMKLRPCHPNGYSAVVLFKNGKTYPIKNSALILMTFVGPRPHKMDACHNNGNRSDDRLENLRWDTRKNNHADAIKHNTWAHGEQSGSSKLTDKQIRIIRWALFYGAKAKHLSKAFCVTVTNIYIIGQNKTWKHIK